MRHTITSASPGSIHRPTQPLQLPDWWVHRSGLEKLLGFPLTLGNVEQEITEQLKRRTPDMWSAWGNGPEAELARIISDWAWWPDAIFLPEDPFKIVVFDSMDGMALTALALSMEEHLGGTIPDSTWHACLELTFMEAIRVLLKTSKAGGAPGHHSAATKPGR